MCRKHIFIVIQILRFRYEELGKIAVITKDGTEILLLENGKFVLPGTGNFK